MCQRTCLRARIFATWRSRFFHIRRIVENTVLITMTLVLSHLSSVRHWSSRDCISSCFDRRRKKNWRVMCESVLVHDKEKKPSTDQMTMASRTLLMLRRRHAILSSIVNRSASHRKRPVVRTLASSSKAAVITEEERIQHDHSDYRSFALAALATAAAASFVHFNQDTVECGSAATAWDPQSIRGATTPQPRNVMLHRMRSIRARNLEDKYNVEWTNLLGEGAYGSVHPARLKATGEKVSHCCPTRLSFPDTFSPKNLFHD